MDREKVIKGLECCMVPPDLCDICPYAGTGDETHHRDYCNVKLIKDAIALLKAQEPVEPTIGRCEEYDGHDSWWYQCGKCGTPIDYNDKYCRMCGQAVKWE